MIRGTKVVMQDGTELEAGVIWADLMRVEQHFQRSWSGVGEDVPLSMPTYLAWAALKRSGQVTESYDAWWPNVAQLDLEADDEDGAGADPS